MGHIFSCLQSLSLQDKKGHSPQSTFTKLENSSKAVAAALRAVRASQPLELMRDVQ